MQDGVHALLPGGPQAATVQRVAKLVGLELRTVACASAEWGQPVKHRWPAKQQQGMTGRELLGSSAGCPATKQAGPVHLIAGSVQPERGICYAVHHPSSNSSKVRCVVLSIYELFRFSCTDCSHLSNSGERAHQVLIRAVEAKDHIRNEPILVGHHDTLNAGTDGDDMHLHPFCVFKDQWAQDCIAARSASALNMHNCLVCVPHLCLKAALAHSSVFNLRNGPDACNTTACANRRSRTWADTATLAAAKASSTHIKLAIPAKTQGMPATCTSMTVHTTTKTAL